MVSMQHTGEVSLVLGVTDVRFSARIQEEPNRSLVAATWGGSGQNGHQLDTLPYLQLSPVIRSFESSKVTHSLQKQDVDVTRSIHQV